MPVVYVQSFIRLAVPSAEGLNHQAAPAGLGIGSRQHAPARRGDSATLPTHQPALITAKYAFTKSPTPQASVVHFSRKGKVIRVSQAPGQEQSTL